MDLQGKLLLFLIDLILPLAVGLALRHQRFLGEVFFSRMIMATILLFYPILTGLGFWAIRLDITLLFLPLFGIITHVAPAIIGFHQAKKKFTSPLNQGSYVLSAILSNSTSLGGLSAFILFGETGFALAQLILLFAPAILFMMCYPLAQHYQDLHYHGGSKGFSFKALLLNRNQLPTLGIVVGLLLNLGGVPRPESIRPVFDTLVHISAWTTLLPIGFSLDFSEMKRFWRDTLDLVWIKFIAIPVTTVLPALPFISDSIALKTLLVLSVTPVAMNAVITSKLYDLNLHIAMAAFVITTTVYLFLIFPILMLTL